MLHPIIKHRASEAAFGDARHAAHELSLEPASATLGWNPLIGPALTALEDTIKDLRKHVAPVFASPAALESRNIAADPLPRLLDTAIADASDIARMMREAHRSGRESDLAHGLADRVFDRGEQIVWTEEWENFNPKEYAISVQFEALRRRVPEELVWAFLELGEAVANIFTAMRYNVVLEKPAKVIEGAVASIEMSLRAREHGRVAVERQNLREKLDAETAAMIRRIRWSIRGEARKNPRSSPRAQEPRKRR